MNETTTRTEADAIIAITQAAASLPQKITSGMADLLLLKDGTTKSLECYQPYPFRKRAAVRLSEPASFIAYVLAHTEAGTSLFGSPSPVGGYFSAIIDYHQTDGGINAARWGDHAVAFDLQPTPEWLRWSGAANKSMAQTEFAEFLEDNVGDVIRPSGAELLEVALTLQAAKSVNFRSAVRLANGQHQLGYQETINATAGATGSMEIPERFALRFPLFEGGAPVEMVARLRYRITDGRLTFSYRLDNAERTVRDQWQTIREGIEKACGRPVHRGSATITPPKP